MEIQTRFYLLGKILFQKISLPDKNTSAEHEYEKNASGTKADLSSEFMLLICDHIVLTQLLHTPACCFSSALIEIVLISSLHCQSETSRQPALQQPVCKKVMVTFQIGQVGLDQIIGKISSLEELTGIGTGCLGKGWKGSKMWIWPLQT